jgi:ribosomal-protein-alanine N-acetyltransferase
MKNSLSFRYQQVGDAKRFLEILSNPAFTYFPDPPKTIEAEKEFLRNVIAQRKEGRLRSYAILLNGKVIGATGIHILNRSHCVEIGYFVDEAYWGRGIACEALRFAENVAFNEMGMVRIEINMVKANKASERVAIKCGYHKEGIGRKKLPLGNRYVDCYVYAKVRD